MFVSKVSVNELLHLRQVGILQLVLHTYYFFIEPKPSIYELALAYAAKYGQPDTPPQLPLSVTVALPISLLVILTIGFIWWRENVKRKLDQEKISLINIKKLRELDNFSSLEHMEKFSSRLGTKASEPLQLYVL